MNISNNGKAILAATRELSRKWAQTREYWRDLKSDEFEQNYLADLIGDVERALPILEELDKTIAAARRECE